VSIDQALRLFLEDSVEEDLHELTLVVAFPRSVKLLDDVFKDLRLAIFSTVDAFKQSFCPDDAVNEFFWPLSDRAYRETLFFDPVCALVALGDSFLNRHTGGFVAICASFDQWDVEVEAHRVDEVSGLIVIKSIDDQGEVTKESVAESVFLDPPDVVLYHDLWVLSTDRFLQCAAL